MSRVVVIGAGLGGLAAAARLAALGHAVSVCEQAPVVGGKLGWFSRDGFGFDTGPSLLTLPQVFRSLFAATGDPLESVLDLVPVQPIARYRFADGTTFDSTGDRDAFCAALDAALRPGSGADWRRFTARAARIWAATEGPFLTAPLGGPLDLLRRSARIRDLVAIAPWRTLRGLGSTYLRDPRLRTFLDRYATYAGSDPRRAPAALAVVPHVEQTYGAWYIRGGLHRLATAVRDRATERGALIRTSTDVVAVTTAGGRANGVRLADGSHLPADVVVSDADARALYADLAPHPRAAAARRRLRRTTPSLSAFVLLLGLRGRTPGLVHHTVWFPADYDAEFDAVFRRRQPVPDPTIYVAAPDDPTVRPDDDSEAWFVLVNAPAQAPDAVDWTSPGRADRYADHVLARLAARGLDVRDRVVLRTVRTPADLARTARAIGGSIYGPSSNGARAAFLRAANRSPLPGLFLVGGSAHPGGGLPLVALSAHIVSSMIGAP